MSEFYLSDLSGKDKPWDYHRALAELVKVFYKGTELERYADRIAECALRLEFALTAGNDDGERVFKLQTAKFCRVRQCPVCQWRRSLMWNARFLKALPCITRDYPQAKWVFLTLTVRNCPIEELRSNLDSMNEAFKRFTQRKVFPAIGFVKSVEVTRGQAGDAHPHFHVLMMVDQGYFAGRHYISQAKWTELWKKSLRIDYNPVVDVRTVKPKVNRKTGLETGGLIDAIKETLKYTVKGQDLVADPAWLIELTYQLHKSRSVSLGGVLKNYLSEAEPEDSDLIHGDDDLGEPLPDEPRWWFGWREMEKRYRGKPKSDCS